MRRATWVFVGVLAATVAGLGFGCSLSLRTVQGQDVAEAPSDLVMGPYVNGVTESGAKVHWVAPAGVKGSCQFLGGSAGAKVEIKTSPITDRTEVRRTAVVTGLKPGQTHKYVVTSGKERAEGSFQTAPAAGSREPFTFIAISDTQSYPRRHKAVVEAILREPPPAFLVITGDLTGDGPDWPKWKKEFFGPAGNLLRQTTVWTARGNHEKNGVAYKELFHQAGDGPHRSFDYGNLHVVCVDQYEDRGSRDLDEAGMAKLAAWLDRDLAASKAEWKIVAYHQPTFNVGGHGSEWGRQDILPVLEKHGVDVVLSGHSHLHERFVPIGPKGAKPIIHVVVSSSGGVSRSTSPSPILASSHRGQAYCVFAVHGSRLEMTAKTPEGEVIDRLGLQKTGGVYQKEIMDAAIATEDAAAMAKVFTSLPADVPARPKAGEPIRVTLLPGHFPPGSKVRIAPDANSEWKAGTVAFQESNTPVALTATPPAGVLLGESRGFSPALTVAVELEHKGRKFSYPAVPILMTTRSIRELVPPPVPVRVAAAAAAITIDGNLADWRDVSYLQLPSTQASSKDFKLSWRAEGLLGAVQVVQKNTRPNPDRPWEGDGLQLYIEADAQRRLRVDSTGTPLKLYLLPQAGREGGKMTVRQPYGRPAKEPIQAAWLKTADGYTIEFCIPTRNLTSSRLAAGRKMGFHFVLRRGDQIVEQFSDTTAFRSVGVTPAYWGQIQLAD